MNKEFYDPNRPFYDNTVKRQHRKNINLIITEISKHKANFDDLIEDTEFERSEKNENTKSHL